MDKMDKKIKALFFDIDGTLVSFRTHKIPQSTVDALENAKRNGVAAMSACLVITAATVIWGRKITDIHM